MNEFHYHKCHTCKHVWGHQRPAGLPLEQVEAMHHCPLCGEECFGLFGMYQTYEPTAEERAALAAGVQFGTPESEGSGI